jgi:hypothetical protein
MKDEDITYEKVGSHAQDTIQYTIMSYFKPDWYPEGGGIAKLSNPGSVSIGDVTVTEGNNGSQLATFRRQSGL